MRRLLSQTYMYGAFPVGNSNSKGLGGEAQGGNRDPCSFDPFNSIICSRVERVRFGKGCAKMTAALNFELVIEHPLPSPCPHCSHVLAALICSAFPSKSRHFLFSCLLLASSVATFNWRMQCSIASRVAPKASCFELAL